MDLEYWNFFTANWEKFVEGRWMSNIKYLKLIIFGVVFTHPCNTCIKDINGLNPINLLLVIINVILLSKYWAGFVHFI